MRFSGDSDDATVNANASSVGHTSVGHTSVGPSDGDPASRTSLVRAHLSGWGQTFGLVQLVVVLLTAIGFRFRLTVPLIWAVSAGCFVGVRARMVSANGRRVFGWFATSFGLLSCQYCLYACDPCVIYVENHWYFLTPTLAVLAAGAWVRALIIATAPLLSDSQTRKATKRVCAASTLLAAWMSVVDVNVGRLGHSHGSLLVTLGLIAVIVSLLSAVAGVFALGPVLWSAQRVSDLALLSMFPLFALGTLVALSNREALWMLSAFLAVSVAVFAAMHPTARNVGTSMNERTVVTELRFSRVSLIGIPGLLGVAVVAFSSSTIVRLVATVTVVLCQAISLRAFERRLTVRKHASLEKVLGQLRAGLVDHHLRSRFRLIVRLHDDARAGLEVALFMDHANMFEPLLVQAMLEEDRRLVHEAALRLAEDAASHLTAVLLLMDVDEPFLLLRIPGDLLADDRFCDELRRRLSDVDLSGLLLVADSAREEQLSAVHMNLKRLQDRGAWAGVVGTPTDTTQTKLPGSALTDFDPDFLLVPAGEGSHRYTRMSRTLAVDVGSNVEAEMARLAGIEFGVGDAFGQFAPIGSLISPARHEPISAVLRVAPEMKQWKKEQEGIGI